MNGVMKGIHPVKYHVLTEQDILRLMRSLIYIVDYWLIWIARKTVTGLHLFGYYFLLVHFGHRLSLASEEWTINFIYLLMSAYSYVKGETLEYQDIFWLF